VAIASTTKIMTAIVALESLKLDTPVTASAKAEATEESRIDLEEGEVLTAEQLLYALLVKSANDAAVALAEASAGSVKAFVKKMNQKAKALGLTNTHFANCHGLDEEGHYSSAKDLATLARYAMKSSEFRKLVRTWSYAIPWPGHDSPRVFTNHNLLLARLSWITGVKTGYTGDAGYCLVASGTKEGVSLVSVVLGQPDKDLCWAESEALLNYGFNRYRQTTLVKKGVVVTDVKVPYHLVRRLHLVAASSLSRTLFEKDTVATSVRINRAVALPVQTGDVFGEMEFAVNGNVIGSVDLVAADSFRGPPLQEILTRFKNLWPPTIRLADLLGALPEGG
jgi:D-alanyl-D-alanine carboxypeptidase